MAATYVNIEGAAVHLAALLEYSGLERGFEHSTFGLSSATHGDQNLWSSLGSAHPAVLIKSELEVFKMLFNVMAGGDAKQELSKSIKNITQVIASEDYSPSWLTLVAPMSIEGTGANQELDSTTEEGTGPSAYIKEIDDQPTATWVNTIPSDVLFLGASYPTTSSVKQPILPLHSATMTATQKNEHSTQGIQFHDESPLIHVQERRGSKDINLSAAAESDGPSHDIPRNTPLDANASSETRSDDIEDLLCAKGHLNQTLNDTFVTNVSGAVHSDKNAYVHSIATNGTADAAASAVPTDRLAQEIEGNGSNGEQELCCDKSHLDQTVGQTLVTKNSDAVDSHDNACNDSTNATTDDVVPCPTNDTAIRIASPVRRSGLEQINDSSPEENTDGASTAKNVCTSDNPRNTPIETLRAETYDNFVEKDVNTLSNTS
ncbi:hypothetical protein H0H92_002448 [Tricholoma furcatifolium]|nr:hypothetical protein H0H92_002448 [Tricholoma furcatifolium]